MNPLTLVKRIQKINSTEAALGVAEGASWHAKYKESAYIYVGGIPFDLTEGDLLAVFSQYGEIVDVNLVRDKGTGKSKGFAFLAYEDQRSTVLAVDNLNGAKLLGRIVRVDHVSNYKKKEEEDEEKERQKREARGVCRAFQRGECNRGDACKFSHDEHRSANTGWGAKDSDSRWDHDKYEGPSKGHRRSEHAASNDKAREDELKLSSSDRDGWRSGDGNGGNKRSHPKWSEPNSEDQDRREIKKQFERNKEEQNPKEKRDRHTNEKEPRKHEIEKCSRYTDDEDRVDMKKDRERQRSQKHSRYNEDQDKLTAGEYLYSGVNEKQSRRFESGPYSKEDHDKRRGDGSFKNEGDKIKKCPREDSSRGDNEKKHGKYENEWDTKRGRDRGRDEKRSRYD